MTDERLIEEAAKRYPDIEADPVHFPTGWSREQERNAFIAGAVFEKAHTPTDDERAPIIDEHTDAAWQTIADALGNLGYDLNSHEDTAAWVQQYLFRRSEPQGEPSDAQVPDADALSNLLDEMNEGGEWPNLPFRDAQDIAGVAYLVDEGDTTRAVFLSDPGEDRGRSDGHGEDDEHYIGMFERPIDELHGPITVLRASGVGGQGR